MQNVAICWNIREWSGTRSEVEIPSEPRKASRGIDKFVRFSNNLSPAPQYQMLCIGTRLRTISRKFFPLFTNPSRSINARQLFNDLDIAQRKLTSDEMNGEAGSALLELRRDWPMLMGRNASGMLPDEVKAFAMQSAYDLLTAVHTKIMCLTRGR